MGFANFIRGIVAQANPFDGGKTYGSYNPPKRKPQPGDSGYQAPQPSQSPDQNQPQLSVQRPENLFAGLNQNLKLPGSAPQNNISVVHAPNLTSLTPPNPGTVVQPQQPLQVHVAAPQPLQMGSNTIAPSPQARTGVQHFQPTPPAPLPSTAEIAARSAGAVGSNLVGGLLGVAKGITQLPSTILSAPQLVRLGAAKLTGNQQAAQNIGNDNGTLAQLAKKYENFVRPVTSRLTSAETATDTAAHNLAPSAPNYVKPVAKVLSNLIPIDAAVSGLTGVTRARNAARIAKEGEAASGVSGTAGEIGNVLSESQLQDLTKPPTPIQVNQPQPITVHTPPSEPISIPVDTPQGSPIRELGGDTPGQVKIPTSSEAAAQRAKNAFDNQPAGRPDQNIEGVTPANTGNTGVFTRAEIQAEQKALDESLAKGEINKTAHKAASNELKNIQPIDETPKGQKIEVKQVNTLPIQDKTVVPQNLPETPGTVRVTDQNSPMAAKSEAVAGQPVVAPPAALPKEVQAVLDNPKQFSKRQVAAARNQRKLAKQLNKTKSDTQEIINSTPDLAPKPEGNPGFVPTGEFRKGENGNVSEVAHGSAEAAQGAVDTANLSSSDVLAKANQDVAQNGLVSPESARNLQAMIDSGRFSQTSPEYRAMAKTLYGAGSQHGRGLSLFNPVMRRTATGDQLTNRFVSKLYGVAEDGSKLTDAHVAAVSSADNAFTGARDAANQALDRYNATKSSTDFAAWKQAQQTAEDAERQALITEYKVANEVLKGNKDPNAVKAVQDAEKKAGVYQMDWIDANMLSGTGTFARNFANTSLVRLENRMFGGRGYSSKGAKLGNAIGNRNLVTDFNARNHLDQNIVSKTVKQWSTTGNMLGESHINAVGSARAYKFYENQLKAQGVSGDQLAHDTEVLLHTDPQGMRETYNQWSLSENALSGLTHSKKIEQTLADAIASKGGGKLSQVAAKAVVRLTVGFPTVIGRSLLGGAKRATLGLPDLGMAGKAFANGDTQAMKDALYAAKVHAGSGAMLYALGTGLAEAGLISPSYPSDKAEQARWKSEGIQPNSIKIGGSWFGIPGYFGSLALPLIIPANVMGKSNAADVVKGVVGGLQDLAPTTGLINFVNGIEGRSGKQWVKDEITSLTRAVTPVGALLNEIAKMTDPTKNDTTTKDAISNLLDNIASGIPGVNNKVNTIDATDANGNVLHNPNPVAIALGAQGSVQPQGQQDVKQAQDASNKTYQQLQSMGVTQDKNLTQLIDKKLLAQMQSGQTLKPEDVKKVQDAVTKGVTAKDDNNWRQNGQYSTDKAALQVKLQMLEADPLSKPSEKDLIKTQIARDGVLATNKIPYADLKLYESTSLNDWRDMGKSDNENYDPATYQKLWNLDQLFAKAGASYNSKDVAQQKFKAKAAGSGSGSKSYNPDFGKLKAGTGAPNVQQYQSIDAKSGIIPHISIQRPNIVHQISRSGGI